MISFFSENLNSHKFSQQIFCGFYLRNQNCDIQNWCVFANCKKKKSNQIILMLKNHHHRIVKKRENNPVDNIRYRISHWTDNEQSICILNEIHEFQAKSTIKGENNFFLYVTWKASSFVCESLKNHTRYTWWNQSNKHCAATVSVLQVSYCFYLYIWL